MTPIVLDPSGLGEWNATVCRLYQIRSQLPRNLHGLASTGPFKSPTPFLLILLRRPPSTSTFSFPHPPLQLWFPPLPVSFSPTCCNHVVLTPNYKTASIEVAESPDNFSALFEIPQLDLLQSTLPTFTSDWTEFLNFEPELSLFPSSPSLASSSASTPPLVDDASLSPSSPFYNDLSSPDSLLTILPHLSDKETQLPTVVGPIIHGECFLLPPGENAGIPSVGALLSVH